MSTQQHNPAGAGNGRSKRRKPVNVRPDPNGSLHAQRNYERYLALARAEARNGNTVGAENYYQYAEHYYRTMNPDAEAP
jgi:Domain of unknown function (DUF4167)